MESASGSHNFQNQKFRDQFERLIRAGLYPLMQGQPVNIKWTLEDDLRSVEFESYEITEVSCSEYTVDIWYTNEGTRHEPPYADNTTIFFDRKTPTVALYDALKHLYSERVKAALDDENEAIAYEEHEQLRSEITL